MSTATKTFEKLLSEVRELQDKGDLPTRPTKEQRISWAYGQTKIENSKVTMDHAVRAVEKKLAR